MTAQDDLVARVIRNPSYQELVARRGRTSMVFLVIAWVIYAGYILTLAFNPTFMAHPVGGMTMSYGVLGAVLVCIAAVVMICLYVYISNKVFDPLLAKVVKEVQ